MVEVTSLAMPRKTIRMPEASKSLMLLSEQGDLGAKRAAYEARWQAFVTTTGPILYGAVPWLLGTEEGTKAMILYGTNGKAEERKRLRLELMRWHPDKFVAKFGSRVVEGDRQRVAQGVNSVSQMLNHLNAGA